MPAIPPARRPSQPTSLGDHEGRIRALERSHPSRAIPYAYLSTGATIQTVPTPTFPPSEFLIDFDPANVGIEFTTNDEDMFSREAIVIAGAAYFNGGSDPVHSVSINLAGRYKLTRTLFSGFGSPTDKAVSLALASGSNFTTGAFQIGNSDRVIDQYQYVTTLLDVTDVTGPIVVSVQNNAGGGDITVTVTMLVELLDDESHGGIV